MDDDENGSVLDMQVDVKWWVFDEFEHYWVVESKSGLVDVGQTRGGLYPESCKLQSAVIANRKKVKTILLKGSSYNLISLIFLDDKWLLIVKIGHLDALYIFHYLHFVTAQYPNDLIIILNVHLLHKGLVKQRVRNQMTDFLVRGFSKRSDQLKTVVHHFLLFIWLIILLLQPLQIIKDTPRDTRS